MQSSTLSNDHPRGYFVKHARIAAIFAIFPFALLIAACSSDDPTPTLAPTATGVPATSTPVPTATPTPVPGATTIVLTADADATLYSRGVLPAANGAGEFLFVGSTNGTEPRRALVRFDVAGALPAGATIASARLVLNVDRTKAEVEPASVHRVTASWTEGTAHSSQSGQGSGTEPDSGDATWEHRS
jgi:hypothetical protein